MQRGRRLFLWFLCWLWLLPLIFGLNAAMKFINVDLLGAALVLFLVADLAIPRQAWVAKVFIALVIIHRSFFAGSIFELNWLNMLVREIAADLAGISASDMTVLTLTSTTLSLLGVIAAQTVYKVLVRRGRGVLVLLGFGAALLATVNLWAGKNGFWSVSLYTVLGLAAMATSRVQWDTFFPLHRWLSSLLVLVALMTAVAWALPAGNFLEEAWWENLLGWEWPGPREGGPARVGYSRYSETSRLGGPLREDSEPVLFVQSPVPVYLRGDYRVTYIGHSQVWTAAQKTLEPVPVFGPQHLQGREVTVTVTAMGEHGINTLFVPRFIRSLQLGPGVRYATYLPVAVNTMYAYMDYTFLTASRLKEGDTYVMEAVLPYDDPELLRSLGHAQADRIYLRLPPNIPNRVRELARNITSGADNGYDKAMALAEALRRGEWQYTLDTKYPPSGADFVDWFLFEQKEGYCVHFSSAFVVMARAVGLPSRWVIGYSSGTRQDGGYVIQNRHAHAWAEVWFDDYGWVPFEATPGQTLPRVYPGGSPGEPDPGEPQEPQEPGVDPEPDPGQEPATPQLPGEEEEPEPERAVWPGILATAGAVLLAVLAAAAILWHKWRKISVAALYEKIQRRLRLFGWQRQPWETPREHVNRVEELPMKPVFAEMVDSLEAAVYGGIADVQPPAQAKKHYSLLRLLWHRLANRRRR